MSFLAALDAVTQPIERATGLPNAHYVDTHFYEQEKTALLLDQWAGLATTYDVPKVRDAVPISFLGIPLLLVRDKEGLVRVFQNTCRHRGMILVNEARTINGAIRCPYHSWCYSLKGKLISTPHVGGQGTTRMEMFPEKTWG